MKIYLFAIGGSGARVLRSLAMLLAAGVELPEETELVPIILDPDQGAGNLTETIDLLKRYKQLRTRAIAGGVEHLSTFTSAITSLPGQDFLIPLEGVDNAKFRDYIGLEAGMSAASADLVKGLFSQDNLELDMKVGFKGNPNIGSVVLGQFEESEVFMDFVHDFQQDGADKRIFIISSIFGGTGASGFPSLTKSLRRQPGAVGDAYIGALSLQPYFAVANDPESAIDSTAFYAKTRAALSYYRENIVKNKDVDEFYFLGDNMPDTLDNHEGGAEQRNNAHFIELAGALSIIDFAERSQPNRNDGECRQARMHEFGVEGAGSRLTFKDLGNKTEALVASSLTAFYLMRRYVERHNLRSSADAWLNGVKGKPLDATFVDELELFLERYEEWLDEMSQSRGRSFSPIKLDQPADNLFDCVEGYPVEIGFMDKFKKQNYDLYTERLNKKAKSEGYPNSEGAVLNILSDVSYDLCGDKIGLPSK